MKTVFIGSVKLSAVALETLFDLNIKIDLVCSLDETAAAPVCDYSPLHQIAQKHGTDFITFTKISEITQKVIEIAPDYLFCIGLSQIISQQLIESAGCAIGFHPTPLPKYRGRAPIPWMILLEEKNPKISLFKIDGGTDSGDILHQE
ncbi:MAG: hypothetical protein LBR56_02565, partial [Sporomusaceae bacterium]|nr:hypothetical protein [Sporomusaceae bacterium]